MPPAVPNAPLPEDTLVNISLDGAPSDEVDYLSAPLSDNMSAFEVLIPQGGAPSTEVEHAITSSTIPNDPYPLGVVPSAEVKQVCQLLFIQNPGSAQSQGA